MKELIKSAFLENEIYLLENAIRLLKTRDKVNCELGKMFMISNNLMSRFEQCLERYYGNADIPPNTPLFDYSFGGFVCYGMDSPKTIMLPYYSNVLVLQVLNGGGLPILIVNPNDISYPIQLVSNTDNWIDLPSSLEEFALLLNEYSTPTPTPLILNLSNHLNLKVVTIEIKDSKWKPIHLPPTLECLRICERSHINFGQDFIDWLTSYLAIATKLKVISFSCNVMEQENMGVIPTLLKRYGFEGSGGDFLRFCE